MISRPHPAAEAGTPLAKLPGTMRITVYVRSIPGTGTVQAYCPDLPGGAGCGRSEEEALAILRRRLAAQLDRSVKSAPPGVRVTAIDL